MQNYEDIDLTASRFRIRVTNQDLLKCPKHKTKTNTPNAESSKQYSNQNIQSRNNHSNQPIQPNTNTTTFDTNEQDCKDCQALKDLTKWDNHYFLERSGYDCITPSLKLRIPEGRYNVNWRYSGVSFKPEGEFANIIQTKNINITRKSRKPPT